MEADFSRENERDFSVAPRIRAFPGRVIFDHLAKTGGQALGQWLESEFGSGCVSPHVDGNHRTSIKQFGGQYSILRGHFSFENAEGLDPRYQYVTVLRSPLERVVSWLYFVLNNYSQTELAYLGPKVRRFVDSEGRDLAPELHAHISNYCVEHFCRVDGDGREPDLERLSLALGAIRRFDVVGLNEDMSRCLADVSNMVGQPAQNAIGRVNVTVSRPHAASMSPTLRDRLLDLNRLDLRLYDEVLAWKRSQASRAPVATPWHPATSKRWHKYDRQSDRVYTTPDLIVLSAATREGVEIRFGEFVHFDVEFALKRDISHLLVGIQILDSNRGLAFGINSDMLGKSPRGLAAGKHRISYRLRAILPVGRYTAGFAFIDCAPHEQRELAWHDRVCELQVFHSGDRQSIGYADLAAGMEVASLPI